VIRHHGRIGDQYTIGFRREKPTRHDLKEAVDELLAGAGHRTPGRGPRLCHRTSQEPRVEGEVTHTGHVPPIVPRRWQECHRPGDTASFSRPTYEDAKKRVGRIREAVLEPRMPA
jgi:hypothetical protein